MVNIKINKNVPPTPTEKLEQSIGYIFKNKDLLIESLSHPSLKQHISKQDNKKDYERLELLGDSILNFIITEILFKNFTNYNEGKLAKTRAYLICKDTLCDIATKINLSEYIIMTHGEEISGGRHNPSNVENTMEALIAAIYLDSNIDTIRKIVYNLWYESLSITDLTNYDPKSTLQEWSQSIGPYKPTYEVINQDGLPHLSTFTVVVKVKNYEQSGTGHSVKEAEKDAARKLLNRLNLSKISK